MSVSFRPLPVHGGRNATGAIVAAVFAIVPLTLVPVSLAWPQTRFACAFVLILAIAIPVVGLDRVGAFFILLGITTVSFNDVHPIGALPWMELCDPFLLIGFALLIPRLLGHQLRLPPSYLTGAVGLMVVGVVSALLTPSPGQNLSHFLDLIQGLVFIPVFFAWWQPGVRTTVAMAVAYMFGNCIGVVAAFIEGSGPSDRYAGLTTHPNVMGICMALSISFVPFLLAKFSRRYHWIVWLMAAMSMIGVWITGSRAAFACAAILLLLYPVFNRSIPAALALGAVSLTAFSVAHRMAQHASPESTLGRLLGEGSARDSDDARLEGARQGIEQFLHHPLFGDGWLTIWGAHDAYIQIAAATGIFGLASYLPLLAGLLRPLLVVRRPYGLLATPALAAVMLDIFLPVLGARYVWIAVGLALTADRLAADTEPAKPGDDLPKSVPPTLLRTRSHALQGGRT